MKATMLLLVVVAASAVTGKPVSEAPAPAPAPAPTTAAADAPSTARPGQPEVPTQLLLVAEEAPLVRVLQAEAEAEAEAEEAEEAEEAGEAGEVLVLEGHRHARCRLIRASPTRYAPSRRRQGVYYQRPSYRPFRPRPAYLRPLQGDQPLQIVY